MASPEAEAKLDQLLDALGQKIKEEPKAGWKCTEFHALLAFVGLVAADGYLGLGLDMEVLLSTAGTVAAYVGQRAFVKRKK